MLRIFVDADACPVKEDIYKVAKRYRLPVVLVAAQRMRHPNEKWITLVEAGEGFDAADDYIAETVEWGDIVVTTDIPLAARCLEQEAWVLSPKGRIFDEESIGSTLGTRELMSHLRDLGMPTPGPAPFTVRDHSIFLGRLDQVIQQVKKAMRRRGIEDPFP
ncbi:MAG: YaiI/YqxD family protein [Planctomycetota bacterium]